MSNTWTERALGYLQDFIHLNPGKRFIAPEVRKWSEYQGLDCPESNLAWGTVFKRAKREGIIIPRGFEVYGDGRMHTQSVQVWSAT